MHAKNVRTVPNLAIRGGPALSWPAGNAALLYWSACCGRVQAQLVGEGAGLIDRQDDLPARRTVDDCDDQPGRAPTTDAGARSTRSVMWSGTRMVRTAPRVILRSNVLRGGAVA